MAKLRQFRRLFALGLLLSLAFAALGYRLVDLQVVRHERLSARAQENTQREVLFEPRRGDILDAKGNPLATTVCVKTVCADPVLIGTNQVEVARALAPWLQIPELKLIASLTPRLRQNERGETLTNRFVRYVPLKTRVPEETWTRIQATMSHLQLGPTNSPLTRAQKAFHRDLRQKAIFARNEQMRIYPNQALAAHVLGFTSSRERLVNDIPVREILGADGIESKWNTQLAGVRGWRLTEEDRFHRELVALREQDVKAEDGLNVVLTIDSIIQGIVESALAEAMERHSPLSASGLVIRPRTGEILALATLPNFDPNNPGAASLDARRNRVLTDIAEPGSTFKIVVVSGALNDGVVRLSDVFDCEHGRFYFGGRPLRDHEAYDNLSVQEIITKSSNIGAAKIGIQMGAARLHDYIENFGFGAATGIPLPAEASARLFVHPVRKWSKVTIAQVPMGQGICVTRLQMAMTMCAIANKGWLMRPMLVDRLEERGHRVRTQYTPQRVRRVLSESTAKLMTQALKTAVSPEGTGAKAALDHYSVAGKTGTAQKAENGVYVKDKFFSSFLGFFPADNPELCVSVTLDEPDRRKGYYGGQTAAPVFKRIAERAASYLNIRPDLLEPPAGPGNLATPGDAPALKTASTQPQ